MLSKLLRLGEGRIVDRLKRVADYVNTLSEDIEKLTDAELRAKTAEFKKRHADGETLDDLLPETFAVAREAAWRVLDVLRQAVDVLGHTLEALDHATFAKSQQLIQHGVVP